jgi:predicted RNase H-like nuclease (RuvC/YqgF family)
MESNIRYLIQFAVESQKQSQETKEFLIANQKRIEATDATVNALKKEVNQLKEVVNNNEQQKKSLSLRLLGLAPSDEELSGPDVNAATAKLAYDKIIRPILTSAKSK